MCADYELVAGAGFVSVFVVDAASLELVEPVVPEAVLESEPAPAVELAAPAVSLDLPVDESAAELGDAPVDVLDAAVLPEAALSVL